MFEFSPEISTIAACALAGYAAIYFAVRYIRFRKAVSLALVVISPGWAFVAAVLNGHIRGATTVSVLRGVSVFASLLLVAAIFKQHEREGYRRNRKLPPGVAERRRQSRGRRLEDRPPELE
jgi:hypothetical protein